MKNLVRWAALVLIPVLILTILGPVATHAGGTESLGTGLLFLFVIGAMKTGTHDIASLLAAVNQSAVEFGIDNVAETIAADNRNFSEQVTAALGDIAVTSSDRQRVVGTSISGDMMEVDEYGQGPTQKDIPSYFVGFPLRKFQFPLGWTKQWEKNATAADFAIRNGAAQGADLRRTRYELQRAIFTPTNSTFIDHLVDKASLPVKAMINADSTGIPNGPNGEVFDGATHTHYDGNATLTAAAITAQIADILEHRNGAKIRIAIAVADVAAFSALTGFVPLQPGYLQQIATGSSAVLNPRLNMEQADNRLIGYFGAAEVWTKPWAVANYSVAYDVAAPQKPFVRRVELNDRGLHVAGEVDVHPLRAEYSEHFYGFGAWNRFALHVLRFNNGTYAAPTLTY